MKRLGVVITDGVGFRNFILTDFIREARKTFGEVVIYSCLPESAYADHGINCPIIELDNYRESFRTWFFRKAKEVAHLNLHRKGNHGIDDSYRINKTSAKNVRGYATRFIFILTRLFYSESWIQRYNKWQQLSLDESKLSSDFAALLDADPVDLLFFTHQRPAFIAPLIYEAEKRKIKTAAFIFSWDNLASKGRMAGNFDYYLVWSALMKSDLTHFYSAVSEKNIAVVGTPQFEPYVLPRYATDKTWFLAQFGTDESLPVIVFTCNDSTSKNDPMYLELLAGYIASSKIKANLVVRTSPADVPDRFAHLLERFPFIKWNFPEWIQTRENHAEPWSQRVPSENDIRTFRALLTNCDLLVNVLSTTTLDAFLFKKPVVCPVFGKEKEGYHDVSHFLDYAHLEVVERSGAIRIARDEAGYFAGITAALAAPAEKAVQQKQLLDTEIGAPLEGTSSRIARQLYEFL